MKRIENDTPLLPEVIASCVCEEVEWFTRDEIADKGQVIETLVTRANEIYNANPQWARKIKGKNGRDFLYSFTRHWLAGIMKDSQGNIWEKIRLTGFPVGGELR